ncbi:MAG: Uma2 family endonuclease [Chloroflexaceae bacterium]
MSSAVDTSLQQERNIRYPESDGQPMAENTRQFRWIVMIKENLETLFQDQADVFVAGDLLWYPVEGHPKICRALDAMVVFGRPKGDRGSYQQWEENGIVPQVVFEVRSPTNGFREMLDKLEFYDTYGVEEYYTYDPDPQRNDLTGFRRQDDRLRPIEAINGWVSPRLGIRFDTSGSELRIFRADNAPFRSHQELARERDTERAARQQAEQRAAQLAARLRELGIDPDASAEGE